MRNFEFVNNKANISALFLAILYLSLSVGIGIKSHYCHGELSDVSYTISTPDCECEDESAEMTCCATVEQFIQLDAEIVLPKEDFTPLLQEVESTLLIDFYSEAFIPELPKQVELVLSEQEVYLLYRRLILYA